MNCGTSAPIGAKDHLLRRLPDEDSCVVRSRRTGGLVPNVGSNALQFNPEMSAYWREHLDTSHQLGAPAVAGPDDRPVFEMAIEDLEALGLMVRHTPEDTIPIDCAHTSIFWPGGVKPQRGQRNELRADIADRVVWVHRDPS